MALGHRAVAHRHLRCPGRVVAAGGRDQVARANRTLGGRFQHPGLAVVSGLNHGAAGADVRRQAEVGDPAFDVGQHLRLQRALDGQVPHRPVHRADLDVLPRRQLAPKSAHRHRAFQQHRAQAGPARIVQVDEAGDAAADDGQVPRGACVHARHSCMADRRVNRLGQHGGGGRSVAWSPISGRVAGAGRPPDCHPGDRAQGVKAIHPGSSAGKAGRSGTWLLST